MPLRWSLRCFVGRGSTNMPLLTNGASIPEVYKVHHVVLTLADIKSESNLPPAALLGVGAIKALRAIDGRGDQQRAGAVRNVHPWAPGGEIGRYFDEAAVPSKSK